MSAEMLIAIIGLFFSGFVTTIIGAIYRWDRRRGELEREGE
jgi:hypothetical protein